MKKIICWSFLFVCVLCTVNIGYGEAFEQVYTLLNEQNAYVSSYFGLPQIEDEYIDHNNVHYLIEHVNEERKTAHLKEIGKITLPDVSFLFEKKEVLPASNTQKSIAVYCTHSDESYKPSDGTSSVKGKGGIVDVAKSLKNTLEDKGVEVFFSEETHYPHDAGAYRRSRMTAAELLKNNVDAIIDVHRDGIPDPKSYRTNIHGDDTVKVRLEVGKANQNSAVNKEFALKIKAVADQKYKGLIKDIYMGKGTYNQDLAPNAILFEIGTYTNTKEDAKKASAYMGDVLFQTLYGDVKGPAPVNNVEEYAPKENKESKGAWTGILWVIVVLVVGVVVFALVSSGSLRGGADKTGRSFKEMFGGLFGKHKDE